MIVNPGRSIAGGLAWSALCLALSAVAALPLAVERGRGEPAWGVWAVVAGSSAGAALAVCVAGGRRWGGRRQGAVLIASTSLALLVPLVSLHTVNPMAGAVALVLAAWVAVLADWGFVAARGVWVPLMLLVAGAFDPTVVLWPIGRLWAAATTGRGTRIAVLWLATAMAGAIGAGVWHGTEGISPGMLDIYARHRALSLVLPIVFVGLIGVMGDREPGPRRDRSQGQAGRAWAAVSLVGLLLAAAGVPVSVALVALGLWWIMPAGVEMLLPGRDEREVAPRGGLSLGGLVVGLGILLSWPAGRGLADAGWLAIYVLTTTAGGP